MAMKHVDGRMDVRHATWHGDMRHGEPSIRYTLGATEHYLRTLGVPMARVLLMPVCQGDTRCKVAT